MTGWNAYSVVTINPFWRYAVAMDERPDLPAISFFSRSAAMVFYDELRSEFPQRTAVLRRRRPFRRVVDAVAPGEKNPLAENNES